jgi:hypothetical protein
MAPMSTSGSSPVTPAVRAAAAGLAAAALARVQDPATRSVRVEDYLTALASVTGEAALVAAGVPAFIESSAIQPGSPVFGDQINAILSGEELDVAAVPTDSVLGVLRDELVPGTIPLEDFGTVERLYRHVAATVGSAPWGAVSTTASPDNQPRVLPLQVAFELRPAVDAAAEQAGLSTRLRHIVCAVALSDGLRQVTGAIDTRVAMTLALEVVFGMAKMAPMSQQAFDAASRPQAGR